MTTKERYRAEHRGSDREGKGEVVAGKLDDRGRRRSIRLSHPAGIAWGINAAETGVNILRGIRRPDGADEAEGSRNRKNTKRPRRSSESWRTSQQSRMKSGAC